MEQEPNLETPAQPESHEDNPPLRIEMSQNNLMVNGRRLELSDGPEALYRALTEGKAEIMAGLEKFRRYQQDLNPGAEVVLASFTTVLLGTHPKKVLSPAGMELKSHFNQIYAEPNLIKDEFHSFWQAVEAGGYRPEVRLHGSQSSWDPLYLWAHLP